MTYIFIKFFPRLFKKGMNSYNSHKENELKQENEQRPSGITLLDKT